MEAARVRGVVPAGGIRSHSAITVRRVIDAPPTHVDAVDSAVPLRSSPGFSKTRA